MWGWMVGCCAGSGRMDSRSCPRRCWRRGMKVQAWRDDDAVKPAHRVGGGMCRSCSGHPATGWGPMSRRRPGRRWSGGRLARERIGDGLGRVRLFDFSAGAVDVDGVFPCLAVDRIVVAVSLPDPPLPAESRMRQDGSRQGCRGKLLPGFVVRERDGRIVLEGQSCPGEGIELPQGSEVDGDGFVRVG
jgi:hypothetical protein